MNLDQLDALLSQPLAPVADNGFSTLLVARIKHKERRRDVVISIAVFAAALLLCLLVPLQNIVADIAVAVLQLAISPMVGLAVVLLVLTFMIDRLVSDKKFLQL